jgi:hypothetical protein
MSTQEKGKKEFKLITFTLLGVIYSRLNYSLKTLTIYFIDERLTEKDGYVVTFLSLLRMQP